MCPTWLLETLAGSSAVAVTRLTGHVQSAGDQSSAKEIKCHAARQGGSWTQYDPVKSSASMSQVAMMPMHNAPNVQQQRFAEKLWDGVILGASS